MSAEDTAATECYGSSICAADPHIHGCYADTDGMSCDDPADHEDTAATNERETLAGAEALAGHLGLPWDSLGGWARGLYVNMARVVLAATQRPDGPGRFSGPGWFWTQDEWAEWSNRLAILLPEEYDDDIAQEAVIERALADLVRRAQRPDDREATLRAAVERLHYRCGPTGPALSRYAETGYCHECVVEWPCPTALAAADGGPS